MEHEIGVGLVGHRAARRKCRFLDAGHLAFQPGSSKPASARTCWARLRLAVTDQLVAPRAGGLRVHGGASPCGCRRAGRGSGRRDETRAVCAGASIRTLAAASSMAMWDAVEVGADLRHSGSVCRADRKVPRVPASPYGQPHCVALAERLDRVAIAVVHERALRRPSGTAPTAPWPGHRSGEQSGLPRRSSSIHHPVAVVILGVRGSLEGGPDPATVAGAGQGRRACMPELLAHLVYRGRAGGSGSEPLLVGGTSPEAGL